MGSNPVNFARPVIAVFIWFAIARVRAFDVHLFNTKKRAA
jgi:hypothetical protein